MLVRKDRAGSLLDINGFQISVWLTYSVSVSKSSFFLTGKLYLYNRLFLKSVVAWKLDVHYANKKSILVY